MLFFSFFGFIFRHFAFLDVSTNNFTECYVRFRETSKTLPIETVYLIDYLSNLRKLDHFVVRLVLQINSDKLEKSDLNEQEYSSKHPFGLILIAFRT